jgi:HicB-like protein involved in pilus formation
MDVTPYVTTLEDSLAAAAAAGDEGTRRTATALTAALEPAARLAIMDALSDLALEVTEALGDRTVELRLESGQVRVAVSGHSHPVDEPADDPAEPQDETARITLRLPERLKAQAESAAARERLSLNTWLIRAVQRSVRGATDPARQAGDPAGHRLRGWVQA